ncbi:hypothetical protein E2542_SST21159 [Spatholobus suberectus]|nr:hypothetical protein E2542_SST21159 [Spatholobus suberectus]
MASPSFSSDVHVEAVIFDNPDYNSYWQPWWMIPLIIVTVLLATFCLVLVVRDLRKFVRRNPPPAAVAPMPDLFHL